MAEKKKSLVIGGSGFIGGTLVKKLVERGDDVTVFDRKAPYLYDIDIDKITYVAGDIRDLQAVTQAIYDSDEVYHLAGVLGTAETFDSMADTADINITGTINVWEAIKSIKKKAVYITIGNDWENPYTITKTAAARFALMYNREFDTRITVVRGLNVYGPRQKWFPVNKYFPRFAVNLLEGKKIPIFGDGEQEIDMVYVDDTALALIKAMDTDFGQEQYEQILDAGTGQATTVKEAVSMIIKAHLGKEVLTEDEFNEHVEYLPLRAGEPIKSRTVGNVASMNEMLGFVPTTDLAKGIKDTYVWYKENYKRFYK